MSLVPPFSSIWFSKNRWAISRVTSSVVSLGRRVEDVERRLQREGPVRHVVGLGLGDDGGIPRQRGAAPRLGQLAEDGRSVPVLLWNVSGVRAARRDHRAEAIRAGEGPEQAVEAPVLREDDHDVLNVGLNAAARGAAHRAAARARRSAGACRAACCACRAAGACRAACCACRAAGACRAACCACRAAGARRAAGRAAGARRVAARARARCAASGATTRSASPCSRGAAGTAKPDGDEGNRKKRSMNFDHASRYRIPVKASPTTALHFCVSSATSCFESTEKRRRDWCRCRRSAR